MDNNVHNIIDLDLSITKKKKFRFDNDDNRIIELNTSDMGILQRISDTYPKLQELQQKAASVMANTDVENTDDLETTLGGIRTVADRLAAIDKDMRTLVDDLFNAPVSAATAPDGSMYDPFEGTFRFEHIITLLMSQYESNLQAEFNKMEKQINKHTAKYVKNTGK